jgi:membrane protein insertase Oxa1/YidC/SpoIIIJ
MLTFFDYLYYSTRKFYSENKESGSDFSALAVIALTQSLNILTAYFLYCLVADTKVNINKLAFVILYLLVLILNLVRYSKLDPDTMKAMWENKTKKQKIILRVFLLLYVVLSVSVCGGLAIYIGSKR